ncbi:HEAT repeat domain-containing protein [Actinomyces ruminis]|uniref:PBS lyase heat domain-containing protein repeat-containing protein n=1 Tax=Actinomyces ruminis TaxID=1937003 RepID=A0ABX4M9C4_9ACTO|nr:HEAT repeat domain-containing protein [Actinomyces ruminis]PHP52063.1 PBS lyase heat domain-containing protein repeat-containing protein [Actinomyces ruminis]
MVDTTLWLAELKALEAAEWPAYLNQRSGLPGPRANIELIAVVARAADPSVIEVLLADDGEYTAACAAAALGYRAADAAFERRARELAKDERWRVREAVTIGLQLLGDSDLPTLVSLVRAWADDEDPLVQRAAAVAICEPRLLRTEEAARIAIEVCQRTTDRLIALPVQDRKAPAARTLRKSLGYCWSVAVAADPGAGLPVFAALDTADPDVAWIVTQNRRKKRLSKLLDNPG